MIAPRNTNELKILEMVLTLCLKSGPLEKLLVRSMIWWIIQEIPVSSERGPERYPRRLKWESRIEEAKLFCSGSGCSGPLFHGYPRGYGGSQRGPVVGPGGVPGGLRFLSREKGRWPRNGLQGQNAASPGLGQPFLHDAFDSAVHVRCGEVRQDSRSQRREEDGPLSSHADARLRRGP